MNKNHLIAIEVIAILVLYEVLFEFSNTSIFYFLQTYPTESIRAIYFVLEHERDLKHHLYCLYMLLSVHRPPAAFHKVDPQVVSSSYALLNLLEKNKFQSSAQNLSLFLPAAQSSF